MAPGFIGTDGMDLPKIRTPILNLSDDLSGPLVVLAGIVISMWTNCAFVLCITYYLDSVWGFAAAVGLLSHVLICYSFTSLLIKGFAERKANLLTPWLILKGVEILLVFIGFIVQLTSWVDAAKISIVVILFLIASYVEYMMYLAWKYIKDNPNPPPTSAVSIETVMTEKPPSYDNFTNQNVM